MAARTNLWRRCFAGCLGAALLLLFGHCVKDRGFEPPPGACSNGLQANITYSELREQYPGETVQIQEDLIMEGYVSSSDASGNFFGVIHFQDAPENPTDAFQFLTDLRDAHLFFSPGERIFIKLKGLYLGRSKGVYKVGGSFSSFGNVSVGRLPSQVIFDHVFVACGQRRELRPRLLSLTDDLGPHAHTLVRFNDLEFSESELGMAYAVPEEETLRTLLDCEDRALALRNSGFSDFREEQLPEGKGSITGILLRENNDFFLQIRSLADVDFNGERCPEFVDEFTSQNLFFSELADPNNNPNARFIELFNASEASISLKGWRIERYTNAAVEVSSQLDLSGLSIGPQSTLVIAADAGVFAAVYGFEPDLVAGKNSPADSNGDDNLALVDPFGTVVDRFGVVGVDGTGTAHEFEDGRALRNSGVVQGNTVFNALEWTIYNDSGGNGTINAPQNAPDDFSPGSR
ncbi:DUF5689 domain-containing protein [Maribacter sp. 2307ULW6-5]|uniref:DUF5689 domain-containing protein n=1 Tax=Maribacter sp. 2307ULW6-5 TaxID=3386275 RepID=UPI0039BD8F39